jgi:hypothetical protein
MTSEFGVVTSVLVSDGGDEWKRRFFRFFKQRSESFGIIKGHLFAPDATTRTLERAARTGYKMSRVIGFESAVSGRSFAVYPDRRWINPMADATPDNPGGRST